MKKRKKKHKQRDGSNNENNRFYLKLATSLDNIPCDTHMHEVGVGEKERELHRIPFHEKAKQIIFAVLEA